MRADEVQSLLVTPWVMVGLYFILTVAELFISPLGLAFVSKVAPPHMQGLMQGFWLAATAVGNALLFVGGWLYLHMPMWATWAVSSSPPAACRCSSCSRWSAGSNGSPNNPADARPAAADFLRRLIFAHGGAVPTASSWSDSLKTAENGKLFLFHEFPCLYLYRINSDRIMDQKERIIEQAMQMFVAQGIRSVRMDDIAQQLGLETSALRAVRRQGRGCSTSLWNVFSSASASSGPQPAGARNGSKRCSWC